MEKDKEIDENKDLSPKQRKLIFVYFAWFFMCILMALPFFTRSCISKNELNEEAAVEIKAGTEELNKKTANKKDYENCILFICLSVFCITGIVCAALILIKDDGGIRFAKLNALMKVKPDFEKDKNWVIEEQQFLCCSKQKEDNTECPCKKNKSIETNENNLPGITTKQKNVYLELTKTLMHSITEI
ncbi:hypothetical protein [Treponema porcinum]|uniref:hypothetical protein n=1 Tax=Treponema porcinum TaxID=261392 RepID=UPI002355C980|nr:hypothetical protein [Treponema porcinum]MCI5645589.1 hypothetical protein [Treponema porcinum]MDY4468020.1 hypothetical protein [Treponema porcinum]